MDKTNALLYEAKIHADENRSKDTRHFAASVVEVIEELQEQLAAALAACEAKDECLAGCFGDINPERGYADELEQEIENTLRIKPDASILKAHDDALIERCAEVCDERFEQRGIDCAAAIRALKGTL